VSETLRVVHSTGYRYEGGATSSYNEARMTPVSDREQSVLSARLDITPAAWSHTYVDHWGTTVTGFEVHERHEELRVVSASTVDVHRPRDRDQTASWDTLRSDRLQSDLAEYLTPRPLVAAADELTGLVAELAETAATPADLVDAVHALVDGRVTYLPGVTSVKTTAAEVWLKGAGVCQDLSHLLIGALRVGGVPARYVSGYLVPDRSSAIGEPTSGESHAWVEYWVGSWVGLDPTNAGDVGDHHIVVGRGRDYSDVSPLRGIFTGGRVAAMDVEVVVTRLR